MFHPNQEGTVHLMKGPNKKINSIFLAMCSEALNLLQR